jgi:polysaccharide biosynthesis protein PslH
MHILLLTHRIPYPLNDGGAIGLDYFITGYLNAGAQLSMLSLNTSKHFVNVNELPNYYRNLNAFKAVYIDNKVKPFQAFFNLFTNVSYNAIRFYTKDYETELINLLKQNQYDIIHLDSVYLGHYIEIIRQYSKAKIVCRIHNVEHKIWQRLSENTNSIIKKWYLRLLTRRLKIFESNALNQTDVLLTIAKDDDKDLQSFNVQTPTYLLPFGIDISNLSLHINNSTTCFHIGSMDWMPNIEGVHWFLNEVWPRILEKDADLTCHLAGKKMQIKDFPQLNRVYLVGEVDNASDFINAHNVMIVPILSGDGIRVKILEALAQGKKIVSTSLGARGIDAIHEKDIYIADQPELFADLILKAIKEGENMNKSARKLVEMAYDKQKIFSKAIEFYKKLGK